MEEYKDYIAPGILVVVFLLAFLIHSFWPLLLIIPLVLIWSRKKDQPYYVPPSQQDSTPKEALASEWEQPMAHYPEQMPPMS